MTAQQARELVMGAYPSAHAVWNDAPSGPLRMVRIMARSENGKMIQLSYGHKSEGLAWMRAARLYLDRLADELQGPR